MCRCSVYQRGSRGLSLRPNPTWSGAITRKEGHHVVDSGPYAIVRHPIYTGLLVALAGTSLYDGRWRALLGLAFFAIGFWLKARSEEDLLERWR